MDPADADRMIDLRRLGMPWSKIGQRFGLTRKQIGRYRQRFGLQEPNVRVTDDELESIVRHLSSENPTWGSVTLKGLLLAMGINASEKKIRAALQVVDPINVELRRRRRLTRRTYYSPGSNFLW